MSARILTALLVALAAGPAAAGEPAATGEPAAVDHLREGGRLYTLNRCADALAPLRAALTLDPALTQARRLLGECLAALDRCEEALPHLEQALEEQPRHSDNARTMNVLAGCDRILRAPKPTGPAAPSPPADEHATAPPTAGGQPPPDDWRTAPEEQTVVYEAPDEPDVSAELAAGEGMEDEPAGDQLHWAGAAAGAAGLVLVVVAAALVEDYSDHQYDAGTDRCVSPGGGLAEGACPDNTVSYALWGVGGALVIGGGILLLLHDWGGDEVPEPAASAGVRPLGGAGPRGGWVGLSGRF